MVDPYYDLGCAVVQHAVDDWRYAKMKMRMGVATRDHGSLLRECETFFRGPLCEYYCGLDGRTVLRHLKEGK